jgi:type VI secretion system secreted protein Hcp
MKYEGIEGSAKGKYKGWIELESAQLGTGRGGAAPSVSEIVVTKFQDNSSTHLFRESLNGQGKKVTIAFVKSDGIAYLKIELEGTLITSYSISGNTNKPVEILSLNFTKIAHTVTAADSKSSKEKMMWDSAAP